MRVSRVAKAVGLVWLVLLLLTLWEIIAKASPTVFFPPFSAVLQQFGEDWLSGNAGRLFLSEQFYESVPVSVGRLAAGWGIAVIVGVTVGTLMGRSAILAGMYNPIVRFFMSLPNAALLPIVFTIFGANSSMNIFLVFLGTVWLIIVNTADGVSGVDTQWLRSARSMHITGATLYRRVILPAALPQIMAGLRVSIGIGLILMIISEMYATTAGLGYDVVFYQQTFRYRQMWSAFMVIAILGIVLNTVLNVIEKRLLRWQRRSGLGDL
ncbi:ABC transporter permease [Rhodococcus erythropolis]|uniref:ABC transporter permease n=1 Tax=Rhodococcus erythropolis TaxID=1833 RepID=UPI0008787A8D|nr:ABC transporter permease subunit [Rhodococcus erythropolis]